jgi:GNAT superfamily N-acetyltransferase
VSNQFRVRKVNKDQFSEDIGASLLLATFYGLEMESALKWSVEQRWSQLSKAQAMVGAGESVMLVAEDLNCMPIGMVVFTQTDNPEVRRIDSLFVIGPFRKRGVAKSLMKSVKEGRELHTYAIPSSVSWYKKNGFRVLGEHHEGTTEMTTATYEPKYTFKIRAPIPTEFDKQFVLDMKELEKKLKR